MNKQTILVLCCIGLTVSLSGCTEMKPFERCGRLNCHAPLPPVPVAAPMPPVPLPIPAPVSLPKVPSPVVIRAHFKFNSYKLLDRYIPKLNKIIKFGTDHPYLAQINVDGYCSKVGTYAYNLTLSTQRANTIAAYLEDHGVPVDDIVVTGHSYDDPVASSRTPEGRFMNQRVVVFANIKLIDNNYRVVWSILYVSQRIVKILSVNEGAGLVHFSGLLDAMECDSLVEIALSYEKSAEVVDDHGEVSYIHPDRTCSMAWPDMNDHPLIIEIRKRVSELVGINEANQEPLQVLHYSPGGEYKTHYDAFAEGNDHLAHGGNRVLTVLLYLNDVRQGGWTSFPKIGSSIVPCKGTGVLFKNTDNCGARLDASLHAGLPVVDGDKWIATIWIRERGYI
jgi:prolyl 4-hydroxylase